MMHPYILVWVIASWMRALVPVAEWTGTYQGTAQDIADACDNDLRCAAIMTAIGYHESRFNPDASGDNGQSRGVWQVSRAWGGSDARTAVSLVKRSAAICRGRPKEEMLGWYASGGKTCGRPESSRIRMSLAARLLR